MKIFFKEYRGYIFTYYLGLIITLVYCNIYQIRRHIIFLKME